MKAIVLGSGAGGGLPQWNCGCAGCSLARAGLIPSRTQDSIAVSADGDRWVLVNASPDIRTQLAVTPELHPKESRSAPARDIVLTNADVDHVLGLFVMRERTPLTLWCTPRVRWALEKNMLLRAIDRYDGHLTWREITPGSRVEIAGMEMDVIAAPGKSALWVSNPVRIGAGDPFHSDEDNIALVIGDVAYCTAASRHDAYLDRLSRAKVVLFDGTFYTSDELVALGLGTARAEDMAHWPIVESLSVLAQLPSRTILTHINNTNPILLPDSIERRRVEDAGLEIAYDGMKIHT